MTKYAEVVSAVNAILAEYDFPLTLRQVHYRLVSRNLIQNTPSAYNGLSKMLVRAREKGDVDDTRMEDRARQVLKAKKCYDNPEQFTEIMKNQFKSVGQAYKANPWVDQPVFVEVWVEKDALSTLLYEAAKPYRVTVCPNRGYSSYTYIKRVAIDDRLSHVDKPIVILYFGDHDPSGIQMTEDLERRLVKYGEGLDIEVERVALTIKQVREYKLMPNRIKPEDTRSGEYSQTYGDDCWELDAIEPKELQRITKEAIEKQLDLKMWEKSLKQEEMDRANLTKRFSNATVTF